MAKTASSTPWQKPTGQIQGIIRSKSRTLILRMRRYTILEIRLYHFYLKPILEHRKSEVFYREFFIIFLDRFRVIKIRLFKIIVQAERYAGIFGSAYFFVREHSSTHDVAEICTEIARACVDQRRLLKFFYAKFGYRIAKRITCETEGCKRGILHLPDRQTMLGMSPCLGYFYAPFCRSLKTCSALWCGGKDNLVVGHIVGFLHAIK